MKISIGEKSVVVEEGINVFQAFKALEVPTKDVVAVKVGGRQCDMSTKLTTDTELEPIHAETPEGHEIILHSSSHLLAFAILRLYPGTKFAIGPAIKDGFYYDLALPEQITEEDLPKIEAEMKKIVKEDVKFTRKDWDRIEAISYFRQRGDLFKVEILEEIKDAIVSFYELGDFIDLCRGPHVPSTKYLGNFKLMSIAGAYWRGDEKRQMLTRIYGTSFNTKEALEAHLKKLEELAKRDHRVLGKELELFTIEDTVGGGLAIWMPNGSMVRQVIEDFWREEHRKRGYKIVFTPHIGKAQLWQTSGHLGFYKDGMYPKMELENVEYYVRPMNCPFHMMNYKTRIRSYRDLPYRTAELGTVYRYEKSGVLHGLLRVRGFTQDDAHIFCTPQQLQSEVTNVVGFAIHLLNTFGFKKFDVYLSTRPAEKYVGDIEKWKVAEETLAIALKQMGLEYKVDEGGGAFYGPKIDIKIVDAFDRAWQCTTCQFDFNMPARFGLVYTGEDGKEHEPYVVHRALLGSLERFMGCLIEQYGGAFPLWLAPQQATIIPIVDAVYDYCYELKKDLEEKGIRVEVDSGSDRMNAKIRNSELKKIPYALVVGAKEAEAGTVSVRRHGKGDLGVMDKGMLCEKLCKEIGEKSVE